MSGENDSVDIPDDMTVKELRLLYGDTVVDRALKYMDSLHDAEEAYIENTAPEQMVTGLTQVGVEGDGGKEKAAEKWHNQLTDAGIGVRDE